MRSLFGVPGSIDVFLEGNMFSQVVRQGWRQGPPGSPMTLETCLVWVLSGTIIHNSRRYREVSCVSTVLESGEMLLKLINSKNSSSSL